MSETHKPFRELVKPNSNFEFVEKRRTWAIVSTLAIIACIAMLFVNKANRGDYLNWTIDFKGGTELIFAFENKDGSPHEVEAAAVRKALSDVGKSGFAVSDFRWKIEGPTGPTEAQGMMVRTAEFGAVKADERRKMAAEFVTTFADPGVLKATWSGDRLFVRASGPLDWAKARDFFKAHNKELREWTPDNVETFSTPTEGLNEYNIQFAISGLDAQYQKFISDALGADIVVKIQNVCDGPHHALPRLPLRRALRTRCGGRSSPRCHSGDRCLCHHLAGGVANDRCRPLDGDWLLGERLRGHFRPHP
jgi:hypothetical protein